ncbi:hypothetical protein ACTFIY_012469 [Dictyostelium cf. discoideum]
MENLTVAEVSKEIFNNLLDKINQENKHHFYIGKKNKTFKAYLLNDTKWAKDFSYKIDNNQSSSHHQNKKGDGYLVLYYRPGSIEIYDLEQHYITKFKNCVNKNNTIKSRYPVIYCKIIFSPQALQDFKNANKDTKFQNVSAMELS